jgi:hypothetical protein
MVQGQPYLGGCIPGLGRGRAVVVCRVSGLRGQGHCGVEAHGRGSCVVAPGGGFWLVQLAIALTYMSALQARK